MYSGLAKKILSEMETSGAGVNRLGITDCIETIKCPTWQDFLLFICEEKEYYEVHKYIWRGQRCPKWRLQSKLYRTIKDKQDHEEIERELLERFKIVVTENKLISHSLLNKLNKLGDWEWWALGQHHELSTPLLDWTRSPLIAAYIAFQEKKDCFCTPECSDNCTIRVVYAFNEFGARIDSDYLMTGYDGKYKSSLEFSPKVLERSNFNRRRKCQQGLFTRVTHGYSLEGVLKEHYGKYEKFENRTSC